jgi:hypothetical protein
VQKQLEYIATVSSQCNSLKQQAMQQLESARNSLNALQQSAVNATVKVALTVIVGE